MSEDSAAGFKPLIFRHVEARFLSGRATPRKTGKAEA